MALLGIEVHSYQAVTLLQAVTMNFRKWQHSFVCHGRMNEHNSLELLLVEVNANGIFTANLVRTR